MSAGSVALVLTVPVLMLSWRSRSDTQADVRVAPICPLSLTGSEVCNLRALSSRRSFLKRGWRRSSAPITKSDVHCSCHCLIEPSAVAMSANCVISIRHQPTVDPSGQCPAIMPGAATGVATSLPLSTKIVSAGFARKSTKRGEGTRSKASKEGKFWQDKLISIGIAIDFATADIHTAANACSVRLPAFVTQSPCDVLNLAGRKFRSA